MARMRDKKKAKKTSLNIPGMKDVEVRKTPAPGVYTVKVVNVEEKEGQNDPYFSWEFEIVGGKFEGAKLWNNTSLAAQSLWNLRGCLEALGVEIPDDDTEMDLDDLVGLECAVEVEHETYDGKKRARIVDFKSADDAREGDEDDEEEDEKPARRSRRQRGREESEEDDEKPARSRRNRRRGGDEDDADEDEDTSKSKKGKSKGSKGKSADVTEDEVSEMSQDELEDLIGEHDLDVDLSKIRNLSRMQKAVIAALKDAGIIDSDE